MKIEQIHIKNFRCLKDVEVKGPTGDVWAFIGQNNSGKSAVLHATRAFYGEYSISHDDFYRNDSREEPIEIVLTYKLQDDEAEQLPEYYRLPNNKLKVIRRFTRDNLKGKSHGFVYENGQEVEKEEEFFGARNVQIGKLGEVIYIPAVKELSDELKTTSKSTLFAKLVNRILSDTLSELQSWEDLVTQTKTFAKDLRSPTKETGDFRSINEIEQELSGMLESWGLSAELEVSPPTPEDVVLRGAGLKLINEDTKNEELPHLLGSGAQRSIVNSLLLLWAKIESKKSKTEKKKFSGNLTLLLYEEPEALLHYDQERKLLRYLENIAGSETSQVFMCTHSPNLISTKQDALSSISRFVKDGSDTVVYRANEQYLTDLEQSNDAFDFVLWLNPDRNTMFFVDHVVLVEGATDKAFLNYLVTENDLESNLYIVDCGMKSNIPNFMELCKVFGVKHSVLFDRDSDRNNQHQQWNQGIQDAQNSFTKEIKDLPDDLEQYIGFSAPSEGHKKPVEVLRQLRDGSLSSALEAEFVTFLQN